jgi:uncharacterized membrane protein YcaP (DUF421 family)
MDAILRAFVIYALLMIIFRVAGKRSLAEITTFDLVLLLIISEATQQAMLGDDFSITTALLVVVTLFFIDNTLSMAQGRFPKIAPWIEDVPLVLVEDGKLLKERMKKTRISEGDILEAAREKQGLANMEQVRYAVLERTGSISIVPKSQS